MKERIDHSNYEAWLLDRLEGSLTPEQEGQLDAFLLANPELEAPLDELPTLSNLDAELAAWDKEALKRSLPPTGMPTEPLDDFLIARLDGDLSGEQHEALRQYLLAHPQLQRTERIYALTKQLPEVLAFAAKKELERDLPPTGPLDRYTLDDHLVARMEGDLNARQETALAAYLAADPTAQRQWDLMQRTRIPVPAMEYAAKEHLKKGGKVIAIGTARAVLLYRLRVAATVAILFTLGLWALLRVPPTSTGPILVQGTQQEVMLPKATGPEGAVREVESTDITDGNDQGRVPAPMVQHKGSTPRIVPRPALQDNASMANNGVEHRPEPGIHEILEPLILVHDDLIAQAPVLVAAEGSRGSDDLAGTQEAPATAMRSEGIPVGAFLVGLVRKQVIDPKLEDTSPLGEADAVAVVDKGLRAVGGGSAGLALDREADGRVSRFDLRLGRNLSISAGR